MALSTKPYANKKTMVINNKTMSYIDEGEGDAIVFQHGNPHVFLSLEKRNASS